MLEELARDVTGWPAHVVEFFQQLGWTQNLEHLRYKCQWTDVRSLDAMDRIDGAFDETSHTVDVRLIAQQEGWYNIRNIGFFFWRVQELSAESTCRRARPASPGSIIFSPTGQSARLCSRACGLSPPETRLVTELDISRADPPTSFSTRIFRDYRLTPPTAPRLHRTVRVVRSAARRSRRVVEYQLLHRAQRSRRRIRRRTLMRQSRPFSRRSSARCSTRGPPRSRPEKSSPWTCDSGRLAIGSGWGVNGPVDVFYRYGFSADLGGGSYDRRKWLVRRDLVPAPKVLSGGGRRRRAAVRAA